MTELLTLPQPGFYAGIGSRETPLAVLAEMADLAQKLATEGWTLRSGGARGADSAFEAGHRRVTTDRLEIYLPWAKFNNNPSPRHQVSVEAQQLAARHHPAWGSCSEMARLLHGRNTYQVLGQTLDVPNQMVVCWTADGCTGRLSRSKDTGGTGTAIVLAEAHGIPVFNLAAPGARQALADYLAGRPTPSKGQQALF